MMAALEENPELQHLLLQLEVGGIFRRYEFMAVITSEFFDRLKMPQEQLWEDNPLVAGEKLLGMLKCQRHVIELLRKENRELRDEVVRLQRPHLPSPEPPLPVTLPYREYGQMFGAAEMFLRWLVEPLKQKGVDLRPTHQAASAEWLPGALPANGVSQFPAASPVAPLFVFCVNASRVASDTEPARRELGPGELAVLVVMHHTSNPNRTDPRSSMHLQRNGSGEGIERSPGFELILDCFFFERIALYDCQQNRTAAQTAVSYLHGKLPVRAHGNGWPGNRTGSLDTGIGHPWVSHHS